MCKAPVKIRHARPSPCLGHHTLDMNFSLGPQSYSGAYFQGELAAQVCRSCSDAQFYKSRAVFSHVSRQDLLLRDTVTYEPHGKARMVKHYTIKTPAVIQGSGCYHSSWVGFI